MSLEKRLNELEDLVSEVGEFNRSDLDENLVDRADVELSKAK